MSDNEIEYEENYDEDDRSYDEYIEDLKNLLHKNDPEEIMKTYFGKGKYINIDILNLFEQKGINMDYKMYIIKRIIEYVENQSHQNEKYKEYINEANELFSYLIDNYKYNYEKMCKILNINTSGTEIINKKIIRHYLDNENITCTFLLSVLKICDDSHLVRETFMAAVNEKILTSDIAYKIISMKLYDNSELMIEIIKTIINEGLLTTDVIYKVIINTSEKYAEHTSCDNSLDALEKMLKVNKHNYMFPTITYIISNLEIDINLLKITDLILKFHHSFLINNEINDEYVYYVPIIVFQQLLNMEDGQTIELCTMLFTEGVKKKIKGFVTNQILYLRKFGLSIDALIDAGNKNNIFDSILESNIITIFYIYMRSIGISIDELLDEINKKR